ncbi:MAG: transcriptional repressor, partial [Candidatus Poribacteria bacterium]|nr:transcriptional repressor [Candidatus Poribacteria bacterium]
YDILETLVSDGRRAAPATVYRSLEFLMEQGLIHRINSLNAFIGCNHPQSSHSGLFFICESCRAATELEDGSIRASIGALAERVDFTVTRSAVEVLGTCPACRTEPIG